MAEEIIDAIKYDLVQELCDYGGEDTIRDLIRMELKDRDGNRIKEGDVVVFVGNQDDGLPVGMELTIDELILNNIGMFNTIEMDTRYFCGNEVVKNSTDI
jgi:hypothetical protein